MYQDTAAILDHEIVNRLRSMVKGRDNREDLGAGAVGTQHILQVDAAQWGVSHGQNELAPFLQANVSGALDKRGRNAVSDLGQTAGATRNDHHPVDWIGAASDTGAHVRVQ